MDRPLNILLISYEFPPHNATGGIGSYMFHLSKLLSKNVHLVTVFSGNPLGAVIEKDVAAHCTNYLIPSKNNEEFSKNAAAFFSEYIKSHKVDLIESPEVGACAWEIKKEFPHIPLIVKMHTPGVLITKITQTYQPVLKKLRFVAGAFRRGKKDLGYWANSDRNKLQNPEYEICQAADVLLSPSLALKKWAVGYWTLPESKIKIVTNPFSIDDSLFALPLENRPNLISFIGKLSILKGMIALTEAIPEILNKNTEYKILLVGRDEVENNKSMQEFMQEKLSTYGDRVVFTGALPHTEVKKIYAQSKVCIFPSLWENYPAVILEAMAAGATVAASNAGGIPEIIKQNTTGVLFEPKQPGQIAKAVNRLLQNEPTRLNMAYKAREHLHKQLANPAFEESILTVYSRFFVN